jgi:hypothetical protein
MLKGYTDAWLDLIDQLVEEEEEEEEEPIPDEKLEEYYQSVFSGWVRDKPRDIVSQGDKPDVSDGLTGKG